MPDAVLETVKGFAVAIMAYVTIKTLFTLIVFGFRCLLEHTVGEIRKSPGKLTLDLCYISVLFIAFNIIQSNPPSRLYSYVPTVARYTQGMTEISFSISALFVAIGCWVYAIHCHKKFEEVDSTTRRAILKKSLCAAQCGFLGFVLFVAAVITQ